MPQCPPGQAIVASSEKEERERESVTVPRPCPPRLTHVFSHVLPTSSPHLVHTLSTPSHRLMPVAGTCVSPRCKNPPKVGPDLPPKGTEARESPAPRCRAYRALTCGVPRWNTGVFSILERKMGRRGGGGEGSSETPVRAQPLPAFNRTGDSRVAGCGRVVQSHGRSSRHPIFSTSEPPPERPQHASTSRAAKTETAWTLLAAVAALLLTPSPARTSVVQIRSETPSTHATTRDKHALLPVRIRADQVFNTCPRADHRPVPTDTPEQRHLLSSRCLLGRPSDGAAGLRRGLVAPLLDNARCAGQTVRPTTELLLALR